MINGSEKRSRQLTFELQNSHVCEKRSNRPVLALLTIVNSHGNTSNTAILYLTCAINYMGVTTKPSL